MDIISAARASRRGVNSNTAIRPREVFVVHKGTWRFDLGEHGDDAQVEDRRR